MSKKPGPNPSFTQEEAHEVREAYLEGRLSRRQLAGKYDVSFATIRRYTTTPRQKKIIENTTASHDTQCMRCSSTEVETDGDYYICITCGYFPGGTMNIDYNQVFIKDWIE